MLAMMCCSVNVCLRVSNKRRVCRLFSFFLRCYVLVIFSDLSAGGHSDVLPTELGERIYEYVWTLISKKNIFDIYIKCFFLNVTTNAITA